MILKKAKNLCHVMRDRGFDLRGTSTDGFDDRGLGFMNECSSRSAALSVISKLSGVTSLWFEPRARLGVPSVVVVFLKSSIIFEGKSFFSRGISFFTKSFDSFCDCFFTYPFILCPSRSFLCTFIADVDVPLFTSSIALKITQGSLVLLHFSVKL